MEELITTATRDGKNFALLLKTMKSGINTFEITFQTLVEHYTPFLSNDFKTAFREAIND